MDEDDHPLVEFKVVHDKPKIEISMYLVKISLIMSMIMDNQNLGQMDHPKCSGILCLFLEPNFNANHLVSLPLSATINGVFNSSFDFAFANSSIQVMFHMRIL